MDEARTALEAVIALSPNHAEAKSMLEFSRGAEARAARRDPEVQQSAAEVAEDDEPMHLNPAVIRKGIRELGVSGQPVIFDLPPALAVKRTKEFVRFVHPVLQRACARCHNEQYPGSFQLVQVKTRHDQTADVFRANLDATLRLVDPENLAKSELLSSALVPHGPGRNKRPIFRGSNDPEYQILSKWVNSLRPPRSADGVTPTGVAMPKPSSGDGFATNRANREAPGGTPQPYPAPVPQAPPVFEEAIPAPPGQMIPESATGAQPYAPAGVEFLGLAPARWPQAQARIVAQSRCLRSTSPLGLGGSPGPGRGVAGPPRLDRGGRRGQEEEETGEARPGHPRACHPESERTPVEDGHRTGHVDAERPVDHRAVRRRWLSKGDQDGRGGLATGWPGWRRSRMLDLGEGRGNGLRGHQEGATP